MTHARFRFYEELNDFLAPARRRREFESRCAEHATVKHAIEALGVPHTEVELVLVNGQSVDFSYRMRDGDRVSVYPVFEAFDVTPLLRVRPEPLRVTRFVADAQLGGLARLLRMLGFDTHYDNRATDDEIRSRALEERRIVLSRDRALLVSKAITHGCFVHAAEPIAQLREIVRRLDLGRRAKPFSRCLECDVPLATIDKARVLDRLPPRVAERHDRFTTCPGCGRVYWAGSHWRRMREALAEFLPDDAFGAGGASPGGRSE
jgi:uncharacterized protein with PIN domain